jgi:hypothetical protein
VTRAGVVRRGGPLLRAGSFCTEGMAAVVLLVLAYDRVFLRFVVEPVRRRWALMPSSGLPGLATVRCGRRRSRDLHAGAQCRPPLPPAGGLAVSALCRLCRLGAGAAGWLRRARRPGSSGTDGLGSTVQHPRSASSAGCPPLAAASGGDRSAAVAEQRVVPGAGTCSCSRYSAEWPSLGRTPHADAERPPAWADCWLWRSPLSLLP